MNRLSICLFFLLSAAAQAMSSQMEQRVFLQPMEKGSPPAAPCTNFSGSWSGQCSLTVDSGTLQIPFSETISQSNCAAINEGIGFQYIGFSQTETQGNAAQLSSTTSNPSWNADKTEFRNSFVGNINQYGSYLNTVKLDETLKIVDGKLHRDFVDTEKYFYSDGHVLDSKTTANCILEKK